MQNNNGIHHYLYDANHATGVTGAQRIMKGTMRRNGVVLNGEGDGGQNSYVSDPYSRRDCEAKAKGRRAKLARPSPPLWRDTVYVNPYYIVTHYSNYAEVTKHYYNGTARLAAQLEGDYDYLDKVQLLEGAFNPVEEDGKALLNDLNLVEGTDYSSAALYEVEATYPLVVMSQAEFNSAVAGLWGELPPASTMPCHISMYWPFANNGVNCNGAGVMYFYHPDYLGHTEYITDRNGDAYQYFHYSAFGETLIEEHSGQGTHTDYFRFNGKELDPETGNYYYGARYYDPKVSVWLSVDPWATKYPHITPYNFVENNPIRLVDPTGLGPECEDCPEGNIEPVNVTAEKLPPKVPYVLPAAENGPPPPPNTGGAPAEVGSGAAPNNNSSESKSTSLDMGMKTAGNMMNMANSAAATTISQPMTLTQRGVDASAEAAKFAKFGKILGKTANGLSYGVAAYQVVNGTDNTSTWVDVGVTTAGILTVMVVGTAAAPVVAAGAMFYGIWSIAGGSEWIDNNWGYRKPD